MKTRRKKLTQKWWGEKTNKNWSITLPIVTVKWWREDKRKYFYLPQWKGISTPATGFRWEKVDKSWVLATLTSHKTVEMMIAWMVRVGVATKFLFVRWTDKNTQNTEVSTKKLSMESSLLGLLQSFLTVADDKSLKSHFRELKIVSSS